MNKNGLPIIWQNARRIWHGALLGVVAGVLVACGGLRDTSLDSAGYDVEIGQGDHFTLTRDYGGVYSNPKLEKILSNVLPRLSRAQGWTGESYTATLLDSQEIDIFLLEDTNFYITRGLLALLNSEDELAAILVHAMRHNFALNLPQNTEIDMGTALQAKILDARRNVDVGLDLELIDGRAEVWRYSASEEAAVDAQAILDMDAMGYKARAYLDVMEKLNAQADLLQRLANDGVVGELQPWRARHPISESRLVALRGAIGDAPAAPSTSTYLSAVENLPYGERMADGFIRGGLYVNRKGSYSFRVPTDFRLTLLPSGVLGTGPDGARFAFDTPLNSSGVSPGEYITDRWAKDWLPENLDTKEMLSRPAAQATATKDERRFRLAVIAGLRNQIYRFKFSSPPGSWASNDRDFRRVLRSFRFLNEYELDALDPLQIYIFTVRPGDTVASLSRRMAVTREHETQFRVLNGLDASAQLRVGQRVKLVR